MSAVSVYWTALWDIFCPPNTVYEKKKTKWKAASRCYVVCQGQTNSDIPAQNKPGEEDSLTSVWLCRPPPAQCLISASDLNPRSRKRRKLLFVRAELPNETNVWLWVQFSRLLLVAFYSYSQALSRKKPVMVFSLSTAGSYHSLSRSCCFKSAWVCFHIP